MFTIVVKDKDGYAQQLYDVDGRMFIFMSKMAAEWAADEMKDEISNRLDHPDVIKRKRFFGLMVQETEAVMHPELRNKLKRWKDTISVQKFNATNVPSVEYNLA